MKIGEPSHYDPSFPYYHPIVYVRGFAATQGEIEETTADPYNGFNVGSTKTRQVTDGSIQKFFFESPLVRLMSEHGYDDVFREGKDFILNDSVKQEEIDQHIPYRCLVVHRYYDQVSEVFGKVTKDRQIKEFAKALSELILQLKERLVAAKKVAPEKFRVYLVAHSMGGLVCRCFLQNQACGKAEARKAVDKFFTYATPHNGIDLKLVGNVPDWANWGSVDTFSRDNMASYLNLEAEYKSSKGQDVASLGGALPPERVFNLVGTNNKDYSVLKGVSAWAAGDKSDGLVRIENAVTWGKNGTAKTYSPNAFVHRSHSGHFGIVNSEEGYQNMSRFFFGTVRVDADFYIDDITLPPELASKKEVKFGCHVETVVSVRGCQWQLHRRVISENSSIFLSHEELHTATGKFRKDVKCRLASTFLDPRKSTAGDGSVAFAFDLRVLVPEYVVNGFLFLKDHFEGKNLFRDRIIVEALPKPEEDPSWAVTYSLESEHDSTKHDVVNMVDDEEKLCFDIVIDTKSNPGIRGALKVETRFWNNWL